MFCNTKPILPGRRCALPWTLTPWLFQGIEPIPEPSNPYRRIDPLAGDFALPAPIDPFRKTKGFRTLGTTSRAWRYASPPAPNHARTSGRPIANQRSVPAPTDTPMTISWRRFHREQRAFLPLCNLDQE